MSQDIPKTLDAETVANLLELESDDNAGLVQQLLDLFASTNPAHLAAMQKAVDANDAEALHKEAHAVKGSAANLGMHVAVQSALGLEQAGKSGRLEGTKPLLVQLVADCDLALQDWKKLLDSRTK